MPDPDEELKRLRNLEWQVVTTLAHRLDDGDDKTAEELVDMAAKALDAAEGCAR